MNQLDLLDSSACSGGQPQNLADSQPGRAVCPVCGKPARIKFCSRHCQNISVGRNLSATDKANEKTQFTLRSPDDFEEPYRTALKIYTAGKGLKCCVAVTGIPKTSLKRWLRREGFWIDKPKHNGHAKKGLGPLAKRNRRWAKAAPSVSAMLNLLRSGETLHDLRAKAKDFGWGDAEFGFLFGTKEYRETFKAKQPTKTQWRRRTELSLDRCKDQGLGYISRRWPLEKPLQDAVAAVLTQKGVAFIREWYIPGTSSPVDFMLPDQRALLEIKVDLNNHKQDVAVGQVQRYKALSGLPITLLVPGDVTWRSVTEKLLSGVCNIITLQDLEAYEPSSPLHSLCRQNGRFSFLSGKPGAILSSVLSVNQRIRNAP